MGELELRPVTGVSDDEVAELLNAAYADYVVPFAVDAAVVRYLVDTYDLDRDASRVAVRDGAYVGLANIGFRDRDAWIGGLGVVPAERRRGTGRTLMQAVHEEARSRGTERVWLEVIVENPKAVALYEQLGYEHVRIVEVWSLPGVKGGPSTVVADADAAHAWIREHRTVRDPWQRDDASLVRAGETQGLMVDGAAAVVRVAGGRVNVLQLAGETEALQALLTGARSLGDALTVLNLPAGHPASAALEELGGRVDVRQHEMVLGL